MAQHHSLPAYHVIFTALQNRFSGICFYLLTLLLLCISVESQAQKIGYGPKLGASASLFRGQMDLSGMRGIRYGFSVGGYMNVKWQSRKRFQFEIDVLYSTRGNKSDFFNTLDDSDLNDDTKTAFTYQLAYIEIPFLFKYMLNKGGTTRPYLFAGPVYNGLMTAKFQNDITSKSLDAFESIKRDDFGIMLGWGISSFFIDRWYTLDVRYYHGAISVSDNLAKDLTPFKKGGGIQEVNQYYNSTLSVTLSVGLERSETFFLR